MLPVGRHEAGQVTRGREFGSTPMTRHPIPSGRFIRGRGPTLPRLLIPAVFFFGGFSPLIAAGHNAGLDCFICHSAFKIAGTVFKDAAGRDAQAGAPVVLIASDGSRTLLGTDPEGNIASAIVPDGRYVIRVSNVTSRTWHVLPGQGSCNTCHIVGGNGSAGRAKTLPDYHTQIPPDNDCRNCHHFPASQSFGQLRTPGVLSAAAVDPPIPGSRVDILGRVFDFDPSQYTIKTTRPDVFAPGYFSMFDVILAVAKKNGIRMSTRFDLSCMTYFIRTIDGLGGDYWYHFSYDTGTGNSTEITYRRANRWDEALWRPGVWIKVVEGENLSEIKAEYREEIARERTQGHVIPNVQISINPSNYKGNPPGSNRITVSRQFANVKVIPHDTRGLGAASPYPKPFRPGVVTSLDVLLSLQDQGALDLVTGAFYTYFGRNYINSYYVVAMGFPGMGTAHSSGRQGFIYVTENGTPNKLPNNADGKLHITSDINVIHAPDFSTWRWAELGNPYYESREPTVQALSDESIREDFEAIDRGFNLHTPIIRTGDTRLFPQGLGLVSPLTPLSIDISFNIFEPGRVRLDVQDAAGRTVASLFSGDVKNIGIRKLRWKPDRLSGRPYTLVLTNGRNTQVRSIGLAPGPRSR